MSKQEEMSKKLKDVDERLLYLKIAHDQTGKKIKYLIQENHEIKQLKANNWNQVDQNKSELNVTQEELKI